MDQDDEDNDGDDDMGGGGGGSSKDKGRGSYKCGRCGAPKKGHVCPYQPKLTRKVGDPLPEMRSAAIQVEMDEFMTMRRLNLRIQGFPESYSCEPYDDSMVVGEPAQPYPAGHSHPPPTIHMAPNTPGGGRQMGLSTPPTSASQRNYMSVPEMDSNVGPGGMPHMNTSTTNTDGPMVVGGANGVLGSPIRSSPVVEEPLTA